MQEIIILKKIPKAHFEICVLPDRAVPAGPPPAPDAATAKTCGNKLKKLFNNCRR